MKRLAVIISATLLSSAVFADTKPTTDTDSKAVDMSKVSYLMGRNMGEQLEKSKISLDQESFTKGLQSALSGEKSEISDKDAQQIMQSFQKEMMEKMQKAEKEQADANLKLSNNFEEALTKLDNVKAVDGAKGVCAT